MKTRTATSAGHPGRPNEDFVGTGSGVVVLCDGAGIPGTERICRHGVAWHSHTLGTALLAGVSSSGSADLTEILAHAIDDVAGRHRHTCDLGNPSSPQSAVTMVRQLGDRLDYMVLADAYVVLASVGADPQVITDPREITVRDECTAAMRGLRSSTPAYERARHAAVESFRARRNQAGGYWVAKEDPGVAMEAVTGTVPIAELSGVALLSNGASRIVESYGLQTWPSALDLLRTAGPEALLRRVRHAESATDTDALSADAKPPDDATAAYWDLSR